MSSAKKLVLLLLTVVPALYAAFYFAPLVSLLLHLVNAETLDSGVAYILLAHLAMMLWLLLLVGWYCRSLYRNTTMKPLHKIIWAIVFALTAPFGLIVFWYFEVWREKRGVFREPR